MRIDPKSNICGIPALKVRDAVRRLARWSTFDGDDLARELRIPHDSASAVAGYLQSNGYIEDAQRREGGRCYALTTAGGQFMHASGGAAIPRAKAAATLANFLQRVKALNANEAYISSVKKVFVFGSFLSGAAELGDLDLAVLLERRYHGEDYTRKANERIRLAESGGRRFQSIMDQLSWPEAEVKRFLVDKKRGISLHQPDELERLGCDYKEVFPENQLANDADFSKALEQAQATSAAS